MHITDPLATIKLTTIMQNKDKPKFVQSAHAQWWKPIIKVITRCHLSDESRRLANQINN